MFARRRLLLLMLRTPSFLPPLRHSGSAATRGCSNFTPRQNCSSFLSVQPSPHEMFFILIVNFSLHPRVRSMCRNSSSVAEFGKAKRFCGLKESAHDVATQFSNNERSRAIAVGAACEI